MHGLEEALAPHRSRLREPPCPSRPPAPAPPPCPLTSSSRMSGTSASAISTPPTARAGKARGRPRQRRAGQAGGDTATARTGKAGGPPWQRSLRRRNMSGSETITREPTPPCSVLGHSLPFPHSPTHSSPPLPPSPSPPLPMKLRARHSKASLRLVRSLWTPLIARRRNSSPCTHHTRGGEAQGQELLTPQPGTRPNGGMSVQTHPSGLAATCRRSCAMQPHVQ